MPSFKEARKLVTEYYGEGDKRHLIDWETLEINTRWGGFNGNLKSFEDYSGMKYLGEGSFGEVYELSDKHVLKIIKEDDPQYHRFTAIARKNKDNPFLPNVIYSGTWGGKTIYILEKLKPISSELFDVFFSAFRLAQRSKEYTTSAWVTISLDIIRLAKLLPDACDIRRDNVMMRGDQVVITDPYC